LNHYDSSGESVALFLEAKKLNVNWIQVINELSDHYNSSGESVALFLEAKKLNVNWIQVINELSDRRII
jgi:uncharacterized protein YpuA (DUF1002 family)